MLEAVMNIRLTRSLYERSREDQAALMKRLIAFLWLQLLNKAGVQGFPTQKLSRRYEGVQIKGRMDVRESIKKVHTVEKVVSHQSYKAKDLMITRMLKQCHSLLAREFGLKDFRPSQVAQNIINEISQGSGADRYISIKDYKSIKYNALFRNYEPLIDLSWNILKNRQYGKAYKSVKHQAEILIDMAELWELYLRSILKKSLQPQGWHLIPEEYITYEGKDFRRKLIPDIVFQRNSDYLLWDAKYKAMSFDYRDYDRSDFFQIHTYASYLSGKGNLRCAGLLYPLSTEFTEEKKQRNRSESIFLSCQNRTSFHIDGVECHSLENDNWPEREAEFIERVNEIIQ